ncbi:MAG: carboxypeptidase-like regulatory domain-containing protein [Gemmatimonadales bacterium]|nr:carboxypeptidase-like regulatory domain-containing protein [Gemmatimonadales bacterium]MYG48255.1 carboxypeptidase-like regulatory domain-containing protein [Gemmatimonadales bacterium]MYK01439.1 carboxypeptidase-like regulatory domain-containing protein [Candidatus Palauibacter ramosifaciens]
MRALATESGRAGWAALALVAGGVLAGSPGSARAQEETERETAELIGQVVSASTGLPLEGARVILLGSGYGAITDAEGNFRVPRTWAGRDSIEVRYIGYEAGYTVIDLAPEQTTNVTLTVTSTVIRIADLTVEVRQSRRARNFQGFEERMHQGFGTFFTPRDIINRNPRLPSDLLRGLPNVSVGRLEYGRAEVFLGEGVRLGCPPALYLDGMYQSGMQFDDLERDVLGAVEVYRRDVETPMEFMRTGSTCGAIVVWTPDGPGFLDWARELPDPFEY